MNPKMTNGELHQMLGRRTSQINGHTQIVQSGNHYFSSLRVAAIDEEKKEKKKTAKE